VDFELTNQAPYRIQCQNAMWEPVGGSKSFVQGKEHAKVSHFLFIKNILINS
jgi:hypothetical protein